jgi:hypothetical protein
MQLTIIESFEGKEEVMQVSAWDEIEEVFDSIDWKVFHIFTLEKEEGCSCDISGDICEDGLSASMTLDDGFYVIHKAPENTQFAKSILKTFFIDEKRAFNVYFSEKLDHRVKPKRFTNRFFSLVMLLFLSSNILGLFYFLYQDDLKFLGRSDVTYTRAVVIDIKKQNYGGRYFFQKVTYEFKTDRGVYQGEFLGGNRQGYSKLGDELKIRYLNSDPNVSDYEGRYIKIKKGKNSSSYAKAQKRKQDSLKLSIDSISEIKDMDTVFIP